MQMRRVRCQVLLALCLSVATVSPVRGDDMDAPVRPCLRDLVQRSDLIVLAEVVDAEGAGVSGPSFPGGRWLVLSVTRCLEGDAAVGERIEVAAASRRGLGFFRGAQVGGRILAFLHRSESRHPESVQGVGVRFLAPELESVYAQRIRELVSLEEDPDLAAGNTERLEWFAGILADPRTRREGLDDLRRRSDWLIADGDTPMDLADLAPDQIDRLIDALAKEPEGGWEWMDLAQRLAPHAGDRLDAVLRALVERSLESHEVTGAYPALTLLAERSGDDELKALARRFTYMPSAAAAKPETLAERNRMIRRFLDGIAGRGDR